MLHSDTADLFFRAVTSGDGEPITFELHLYEDTVNNRGRLRDAIESTIAAILDGRLPPGTRELLQFYANHRVAPVRRLARQSGWNETRATCSP